MATKTCQQLKLKLLEIPTLVALVNGFRMDLRMELMLQVRVDFAPVVYKDVVCRCFKTHTMLTLYFHQELLQQSTMAEVSSECVLAVTFTLYVFLVQMARGPIQVILLLPQ